jgi:hypothetical protein
MNEPLPALSSAAATPAGQSPRVRPPAQDYGLLREEGLALVKRWSGAVWTDFGEHDPGVTLLELLCYGLIGLGYRAGFPIEDLIAPGLGAEEGAGDLLTRPGDFRGCEPVTPGDFRRLLIDRVPGLADAWLEEDGPGLHRLTLYHAPRLPGLFERSELEAEARLVRRARRLFHRHRPLGEDVADVVLLRPVALAVGGNVAIEADARPEAVMADILYRLGAFLAPEPRRSSLAGFSPRQAAARLEGPRLARGVIEEAELHARRFEVTPEDLERHIAAVPGVARVGALNLWPPPQRLEADECFALEAGLHEDTIPLSLTLEGERVDVDVGDVRRRLERRWREHRRTYRTRAEAARLLPLPRGRRRDTASHPALAGFLPQVYGVGEGALDASRTPARRAQARQLLGYLALFERQFVDWLDRLSNLRGHLGLDPLRDADLARPLAEVLPSLAPLLIDGGPDADALQGRSPVAIAEQERIADFLLALCGETPDACIPLPRRRPEAHRLAVKRALVREAVALARRRGRGFDLLSERPKRSQSGLEARAALLFGAGLAMGRQRPRLMVLEHVLLRSRGTAEADPESVDPFRLSAIVHTGEAGAGAAWRRRAADALRIEAPAHLELGVIFVDRPGWIFFKRLHRLWRGALRDGFDEAADLLARELRRLIERHEKEQATG